jgi:hypothetical protein
VVTNQEKRDSPVTTRLETTMTALSEVEELVSSGDLDARVQREFRNAMDHIRHTALAVQQWFGAQSQSGDPYAVLPVLATQRVHRASQLAKDLSLDLDNLDVSIETKGIGELYQAVDGLHRRLGVLCKRGT